MRGRPLVAGALTLALVSPGVDRGADVRTWGAPVIRDVPVAAPVVEDQRRAEGLGLVVVGGPAAVDPDVATMLRQCDPDLETIAGDDRFATAVELATSAWDAGPVFVASGRNFPDALAATPLVAATGGALLLTEPDELPDVTADWVRANAPSEVVVLGGPAAVDDDVVGRLRAIVDDVRRIAGDDRYATAAAFASDVSSVRRVFLASGEGFADALGVGPAAALDDGAVLLTSRDALPAPTADLLSSLELDEVVVVGGPTAIGEDVVSAVRQLTDAPVRRLAGDDRYATGAAVADEVADGPNAVVASGTGFPDALAAGQVAAAAGAPLLLVGTDVHPDVAAQLGTRRDWPCRPVTIRPSPTEGLTLGPSSLGGVVLTASTEDVAAPIRDASRGATLVLDGAATITMTYPEPAGGVPAVTWQELLDPTQTDLVVEQPWRHQRAAPPDDITAAWQYTGDSDRYRDEVDAAPGLTITAPFRYFLAPNGELRGRADADFITDMHQRGIEVWPTIHVGGEAGIEATLSDPDRRRAYAIAISHDAEQKGADGVNIDIEGFGVHLREAVTDFTEILSEDVHRWGGVTSFDFTSMTDTWITPPAGYEFWSTAPDRRAISEAVDYAVLMAYDQFNRFRPRGPVASDVWVDEALRYQLRFSDPDRILLGLPLYARIWRGDTPSAVGQSFLKSFIAGGTSAPDPAFGVDRVVGADGRVTWAETADRLVSRLDMVDRYGLAGTASWRLGFDDPATWQTLGRR